MSSVTGQSSQQLSLKHWQLIDAQVLFMVHHVSLLYDLSAWWIVQ